MVQSVRTIFVLLQCILIIAHIIIIVVIKRSQRLSDNRYFLIQILSSSDIVYAVINIPMTLWLDFLKEHKDQLSVKCLLILMYIIHNINLFIIIIIAIDRLIAVVRSLRYDTIVTKRRLVYTIIGILPPSLLINTLLVLLTQRRKMIFATSGIVLTNFVLRALTCVIILITGIVALIIRDRNTARLKAQGNRLHGTDSERLQVLTSVRRSLKDITVLNLWTVIFLFPLLVTGAINIFGLPINARFTQSAIAFSTMLNGLMNPLIYMLTQRKIYEEIKRNIYLVCCIKRIEYQQ